MDFVFELESYLAAAAGVTTIVGKGEYAKLFHHIARQRVQFPLIVIDEQGGLASEHLVGTTGIARGDFVIWSFGETVKEATDLWSQVRLHLETYGPALMGDSYVHVVTMDPEWRDRGMYTPQDASQQIVYYSSTRYSIWHTVPLEVV